MDTLVSYLIRSAIVGGLMLGYYHLALRNRKSHAFNRAWLLTTLLASVVLPLLRVDWLTWHSASRPVTTAITGAALQPVAASAFPTWQICAAVCGSVSVVLLSTLVLRVHRLYRLKRSCRLKEIEGCVLIEIRDRRAPFSFMKNLFWQEGADIQDPVNRKIFDHELAHIRGGHTYDIVFAQIVTAVCWINPFFWLIRRELQMVHEFIADDASVAAGDTGMFAQMLLRAYDDGRYLDPSHHFFHSPIKRRLRMINSSKPPSGLWKALALPILAGVVVLACSKEQNAPASALTTKPLPANLVRQVKIVRDSIQIALAPALKRVMIEGITKANKEHRVAHITLDTLGVKANLDLSPGIELQGVEMKETLDKMPPPPPPKKN